MDLRARSSQGMRFQRRPTGGLVNLILRDVRRGPSDNRYVWTPYELNEEFSGDWWDSPPYSFDDPHYVEATLDGVEVARVELDHSFSGSQHVGAPTLGTSALEIQFIEVAKTYRRRGVGAQVVRRLVESYPNRRLLALSEDADDFWAALGWERFDYHDGPLQYRPLFIAPA